MLSKPTLNYVMLECKLNTCLMAGSKPNNQNIAFLTNHSWLLKAWEVSNADINFKFNIFSIDQLLYWIYIYFNATPPALNVFVTKSILSWSKASYLLFKYITSRIRPWIINLAHHKQGILVEYKTVPGVSVIPTVKMQLY